MNRDAIKEALTEAGFKTIEFTEDQIVTRKTLRGGKTTERVKKTTTHTGLMVGPVIADEAGEFVVLRALHNIGYEYDSHYVFNSQSVVVNVRERPTDGATDAAPEPIITEPTVDLRPALESI